MQGEEQLPHQLRKISHKIKELEKLIQIQPERPRESTKAEELFRLIVDNSYDIITLHDGDLNLTYRFVSPSIKKITNYKPEELINKSPWEFIHPEDQQKMMPLLKRYLPPPSLKNLLINKNYLLSRKLLIVLKIRRGNGDIFRVRAA